jgi:predicted ester cyclase
MAATGRKIDFWGMCMVRVRDSHIVDGWNTFDFLTLYQQIGMLPQLPA